MLIWRSTSRNCQTAQTEVCRCNSEKKHVRYLSGSRIVILRERVAHYDSSWTNNQTRLLFYSFFLFSHVVFRQTIRFLLLSSDIKPQTSCYQSSVEDYLNSVLWTVFQQFVPILFGDLRQTTDDIR